MVLGFESIPFALNWEARAKWRKIGVLLFHDCERPRSRTRVVSISRFDWHKRRHAASRGIPTIRVIRFIQEEIWRCQNLVGRWLERSLL